MSLLKECALVALGGAVGSVARFLVSLALKPSSNTFPWGLLIINVLGSFLIGLAAAHVVNKPNNNFQLFIVVGLLGGFTTFSSFSIENLNLIKNGSPLLAFTNMALSCALGLAAATIAFSLFSRS